MSKKSAAYWMCDRCGRVFLDDPGFTSINLSAPGRIVTARCKSGCFSDVLELCPGCLDDFMVFMSRRIDVGSRL